MANSHRGDVAAIIGGVERPLRLTLGALAELEEAFGADDLAGLVRRFTDGSLKTRDIIRIIGAGLRGAGEAITDDELATLHVHGGLAGCAELVVRLLEATFGATAAAPVGEGAPRPLDAPNRSPGTT